MATSLAKLIKKDYSAQLVEALRRGSQVAERQQREFADIMTDFAVYSLFETVNYPGIGIIVKKDSALFGWHETEIPVHENHSEMVKFKSAKDKEYKKFKDAIGDIVRSRIARRTSGEYGTHSTLEL